MYKEYLDVFNTYKKAVVAYDNLFTAEHPLAQEYVNDIEQLFSVTLTPKEVNRLLGVNKLPDAVIAKYGNVPVGDFATRYETALHNENNRLQDLVNLTKVDLYKLQETIPFDYFRGDEDVFIQCASPVGFCKTSPKVESAFYKLTTVGKPKMWQWVCDGELVYSAVSFPLDPTKLELFYACYYNWLFGVEFPNHMVGNDILRQVKDFYNIQDWYNAELVRGLTNEFEDITSGYYYVG